MTLLVVAKGVPPIDPHCELKRAEVSRVSAVRGAVVNPTILWLLLGFAPVNGFNPGFGFRALLALYL